MKKRMAALLAGAALMLGMGASAQAFTLTISSGADTITVVDNSALDLNATVGSIAWIGNLNGIAVNFASGYEKLTSTLTVFDLASITVSGGTAGQSISFVLSDSGIILNTLATTPNIVVTQTLTGANLTGTVINSGDVKINGTSVSGIAASADGSGNVVTTGLDTIGGTYTLDELVNLTFVEANSSISLDDNVKISPVPEPGTMVLLGAGMLGVAIFGKRRMNNKEA